MPTRLPATSRPLRLAAAGLLASLHVATALGAARLTSIDELNAGRARADAGLIAEQAACDQLVGNARDTCRERARGKERVAKAELDLAHTGSRRAQDKVAVTKLDAAYDLARTQCNDQSGAAKTTCTKQAQAARDKGEAALRRQQRERDAVTTAKP